MAELSEHLRGPWKAFIGDSNGEIYTSPEEVDEDDSADVSVRRGSALPGERGTLPGMHLTGDVLFELEGLYRNEEDPSIGLEARWEQAQAVAAGLNALAGVPLDDEEEKSG